LVPKFGDTIDLSICNLGELMVEKFFGEGLGMRLPINGAHQDRGRSGRFGGARLSIHQLVTWVSGVVLFGEMQILNPLAQRQRAAVFFLAGANVSL